MKSYSKTYLWFIIVAVFWGGSYPAITVGLNYSDPIFFAAIRMGIAALVLIPIIYIQYDYSLPKTREDIFGVIIIGFFVLAGAQGLLFIGQQFTTSAAAAVAFAMSPVFATFFSWIIIDNSELSPNEVIGVIIGVVGVFILSNPDLDSIFSDQLIGISIILLGAIFLALGSVLNGLVSVSLSPIALLGWGLGLSAVVLFVTGLLFGENLPTVWPTEFIISIIYLSIPATAISYLGYYLLLNLIGGKRTTLVSYIVPLFASVFAALILGESITLNLIVGFITVFIGFVLIEYKFFQSHL